MCLSHISVLWREVTVAYIPKVVKPSHLVPKDYRPISLSSFLLRTQESLIYLAISTALHVYVKGQSVRTAQHDTVGNIENETNMNSSLFTLAASFNLEGAFNNVTL